ncbi:hypothetical protein BH09BAC2_BH09BAC2_10640 [soil metagenome]
MKTSFYLLILTVVQLFQSANGQENPLPVVYDSAVAINSLNTQKPKISPYTTSFKKEGIAIAAAMGATFAGYALIKNKSDLTPEQLSKKSIQDLPFLDRWVAGKYSDKANTDSYILFNGSYIYPFAVMLLDKSERKKMGQLSVMFIETVTITGALYTLTAGLVYRSRPFVYGENTPMDLRLGKGGQRSFYGGHIATTAAASFFTAKVYSDFHPGSKALPYVWVVAAVLPAVMAYERMQAGYHFLSDCILSYGIGAATGLLIPAWHKNKKYKNVTILPGLGNGQGGIDVVWKFK